MCVRHFQFEQRKREWEELQESIPEDPRKEPAWVSRPLRGSQDNGNGGWTPLGIMGKDLASDLLAETWRLPSLFPYIPNAVNTLMDELENLGHRTIRQPGGLTVKLRDYQLGTLSFCIDQERLPGGINRHIWAPVKTTADQVLWYSPILDFVRKSKPPSNVCGGFICDEMGLGKVMILYVFWRFKLSLIL